MDIETLLKEREALEKRLAELIESELDAFQHRTHIAISAVDVHLYELKFIDRSLGVYAMDNVRVFTTFER